MIRTLYNGIDFRIKGLLGRMNRFFYKEPRILSSVKSLDTLIDGKKSIARFGDGEFKLMRGGNLGFQKYVNEVEEGRNITDSIIDQEYKNSIILEIEWDIKWNQIF